MPGSLSVTPPPNAGAPVGSAFPRGGFTLVELLVAATVFSVVGLAMGMFLVFAVQRSSQGEASSELNRNARLLAQVLRSSVAGASSIQVPAQGEAGEDSFSAIFPAEPFLDENRDGKWDPTGATGVCSPSECFDDQNGNGIWDPEARPRVSFRLNGGRLEIREGDGDWIPLLEERYGEASSSSVWVERFTVRRQMENPALWSIRAVMRDDLRTPSDPADDLRRTIEILVRQGS